MTCNLPRIPLLVGFVLPYKQLVQFHTTLIQLAGYHSLILLRMENSKRCY